LDAVRKRSGLTKARNTSVIADMTRVEPEAAGETPPAALHAVPTPVAEPQPAPAIQQALPQEPPRQAPAQPLQQPAAYMAPAVPQYTQADLRQPAAEPPVPEKKMYRKTSFFQSKESGARMRSAYMATRHLTGSRTLSDFILAAVEREVEALERQYNEGNQFTADPGSVPRGRPLES
jgi:hypothetical protein